MKYMGSKARISKELSNIINNYIVENKINTYIEPFVGGANLIEHIKCKNKIGSDSNDFLIEMWKQLINGWEIPKHISKEFYNEVKNNKEKYPKELVAVVGFCATYNAKWFGGYAGIVTTKIGTERNYYSESIRNIQKQVPKLLDVKFDCCDYTHYKNLQNTMIYCDIPYQGTTKYNNSNQFDYDKFWNWVREMSIHNIVLVSEYNAPEDFVCIWEKELTTTLDKSSRKTDCEKLFIHKSIN